MRITINPQIKNLENVRKYFGGFWDEPRDEIMRRMYGSGSPFVEVEETKNLKPGWVELTKDNNDSNRAWWPVEMVVRSLSPHFDKYAEDLETAYLHYRGGLLGLSLVDPNFIQMKANWEAYLANKDLKNKAIDKVNAAPTVKIDGITYVIGTDWVQTKVNRMMSPFFGAILINQFPQMKQAMKMLDFIKVSQFIKDIKPWLAPI